MHVEKKIFDFTLENHKNNSKLKGYFFLTPIFKRNFFLS